MIKVLVVDDHDLVRTGIARMLDEVDGLRVVGEASSGEQAVQMAKDTVRPSSGSWLSILMWC